MIQTNFFRTHFKNFVKSISLFDKEISASQYMPISHLVTPTIFSTHSGDLGAVIQVQGISFELKNIQELNEMQNAFGFIIQSFQDEFAVYVTCYRHQAPFNLNGKVENNFAKKFIEAYHSKFENSENYLNEIYITLILKEKVKKAKKSLDLLLSFDSEKDKQQEEFHISGKIQKIEFALSNLIARLSAYKPKVLKLEEEISQMSFSEVLTFFSILMNGEKLKMGFPLQDIAKYVPNKRISFCDGILQFEGLIEKDNIFGAILSIKDYAPLTIPGFLDVLLTAPFEFISTHSYWGIEKQQSIQLINKQIKKLQSTNDPAKSQIFELEKAKDDIASNKINFGFHHNTILILSKKLENLEEKVSKAIKIYHDRRMMVIRETINLENAFWAQMPGNFKYIRRMSPISSNNFSCFCSLHNYSNGYIDQNHLGGALMLIETPSGTPYYFNLHERASGRKDDFSKGHTVLIGPSNAGKTVMINVIDIMSRKYGGRSFFFDRHYGCEIYIRAMKGKYYKLIPGEPTGWNPFQLEDTLQNRKFLYDFLVVLCQGEQNNLTSSDLLQIAEVVDRNYTIPFLKRNLSNISSFFKLEFSGLEALSRYLRVKNRFGKSGDRAYLFDNENDSLDLANHLIGFDMTAWLNDAGDPAPELLPISMFLFHKIDMSLDGSFTRLYLDEGWQYFTNSYWEKKIEEYLVTWRKRNGLIFFASQLPDKIAASRISSALIQGAATHIFLANPKAQPEDYIDAFKLTPRELEIIKNNAIQSRYFLIKQGQESAIAKINLKGLEIFLPILSSNVETVKLCREMVEQYGDDPKDWLEPFFDLINSRVENYLNYYSSL